MQYLTYFSKKAQKKPPQRGKFPSAGCLYFGHSRHWAPTPR